MNTQRYIERNGIDLKYQPVQGEQKRRTRNPWEVAPWLMGFLLRYDDRIKVVWDDFRERWKIWRESGGADYFAFTVEDEDGGYRDLDSRLCATLFKFDLHRYDSPLKAAIAQEEEEEAIREKNIQGWRDDFDHNCREHKNQLTKAYEALLFGNLPEGEKEKRSKTEHMKVKERIIIDPDGRPVCRVSPTTPTTSPLSPR
jgi:hypothetical protein